MPGDFEQNTSAFLHIVPGDFEQNTSAFLHIVPEDFEQKIFTLFVLVYYAIIDSLQSIEIF